MNIAWDSGLDVVVQLVRTTSLHPLGAETASAESSRKETTATSTLPGPAPGGADTVSVCEDVVVAEVWAPVYEGVAAEALPRTPTPPATAATATAAATRCPVILGTEGL